MAEPLKNMLNEKVLRELAGAIKSVYRPFQTEEFIKSTMDDTWGSLELKARGRQITLNLGKYLPQDYKEAICIIDKARESCNDWILMCFPDFVEVFGQDEELWDLSMGALERYTVGASSEFAVRPFIIKHEKRMMEQMYVWSKHENEHVRRLSSEGSRPALPWGQALSKYKQDPAPVLPILEQLKADPSLYVRKSVANHLNDISKTHPELVVSIAKKWYGKNEHTDWIVKHACRTLLKKGNRDVLAIFGYNDNSSISVDNFNLESKNIVWGGEINFSFDISTKEATKVRLEYGIDYMKSNGKRNRKIFQISEISVKESTKKSYTKKHSFADVSTRKHYVGQHSITLIVNGKEFGTIDFELGKAGDGK
jgi:3-methyladenine DNA glycosylase AlkC